ncbi:MAG TPA: hypothetical protein VET23_13390 [Chitinophagaceae bacterium]|nr:hypothetical protein [Chitinophagaceae bacterium]
MTRLTSLLLASFFLLAACNSNKSKENSSTSNKETASNTGTTSNETGLPTNDMAKMMEEMKKMPALSTDQLKAMLPETLMGMKRSNFSVNSGMGYGIADAKYKSDDDKQLHVTIYDCVGTAGVAWYSMMYWGMNMEQEDENGYKKSTTFNGTKAIESYEKNQDQYGLMFPASNRLLVNVEGEKTGLDMVKQAAGSLNLNVK